MLKRLHNGLFEYCGSWTNGFCSEIPYCQDKVILEQKLDFLAKLSKEITSSIKSASKKGMKAVFRPNLTSDIAWENVTDQDGLLSLRSIAQLNFMIIQNHLRE